MKILQKQEHAKRMGINVEPEKHITESPEPDNSTTKKYVNTFSLRSRVFFLFDFFSCYLLVSYVCRPSSIRKGHGQGEPELALEGIDPARAAKISKELK